MYSAFVTAVRTLTIVPISGKDTNRFYHSLLFFPVIGFLIALILYPVFLLCDFIPEELTLIRGAFFTLCLTILTGGLHLDGLADAADGFMGGKDKESILRIMKDSRIGTFGATALFFDLIIRIVVANHLITESVFLPFLLAFVNSRTVQAMTLSMCPYARGPEGTASPFSGAKHLFVIICGSFLIINLFSFWILKSIEILVSCAIASLISSATVYFFLKRAKGITGDCIGAINEIFEVAFLITWSFFV